MIINHVVSESTYSGIFESIFDYFRRYSQDGSSIIVSDKPSETADVHHYHRCHLETRLSDRAVCTVHHDLHDPDPWLRLERFLPRYREARLVVCLNKGQQTFLESRGIRHTIVIPHGYNSEVLHPKRQVHEAQEKITLGIISKYYDRRFKGEAYLHDLAKCLSPAQFRFVLVGERRLKTAEYLMSLGYEAQVFEMLPYRLFQSLYESIDYLLMCSTFEGGPANLSEAMATHTPILATPVGYAPDFIVDERNGLLLSQDVDLDARRISRLADSSDPLAHTLRQHVHELHDICPTWQDVVSRHFEAYRGLLGADA